MKKIFFICFLISIICSGCSSSSRLTKSEYDTFNDYVNIVGEKCMIYIENDDKMSIREKNVYKTRHRLVKEQLNEIDAK